MHPPKGAVELFHGYTYSGIPIAVAAALAVQDILKRKIFLKGPKKLITLFFGWFVFVKRS